MQLSWIIFLCSLYAVFNVSAASIIKYKLLTNKITTPQDFAQFLVDPRILFAIVLIIGSMYFSMKALSLSAFSFVIPISTAVNFVLTVLIGVLFFKDNLTLMSYVSLVFILLGIVLLTQSYGK